MSSEAARKSAEAAEQAIEQMRLEQRAWLGAKYVLDGLEDGKTPSVTLVISNSGKSPARVESFATSMFVLPLQPDILAGFKIHVESSQRVPRQNLVAPGGRMDMRLFVDNLDEAKGVAIASGDKTFLAFATIWYADVFNRQHETRCCFVFNHQTQEMHAHDRHNHMT